MEKTKRISVPPSYKRPIVFGVAVLAGLCAAYGLLALVKKEPEIPFASLTNMPEGATARITLKDRSRTIELQLQGSLIEKSTQPGLPYRLSAAVKLPADTYRDFEFTLSPERKLAVVADGFKAGDLVYLTLNDHESFGRVPTDWSGKLELAATLPDEFINACISVIGQDGTIGMCHAVAQRRPL